MLLLLFTGSLLTGFRPFFFQKRSGRFGKPFHILKFRTIDPQGNSFGLYSKFLRVSSLDELPQLFNIIMGQMSLVGPRPLYLEYNEHYNERHRKRLDVKPGLTGLAQVSGRNNLRWEERFDLDVDYVQNISLRLDLTILMKTLVKVFDVSGADGASVTPFRGYD